MNNNCICLVMLFTVSSLHTWLNILDTWRKAAPLAPVEGSRAAAVLCDGKSQVKQGRPLCTHTSASSPIRLGECGWMGDWGVNQFVWSSSLYSTPIFFLICCSSALGHGAKVAAIYYHLPPGATACVAQNMTHISGLFEDKRDQNQEFKPLFVYIQLLMLTILKRYIEYNKKKIERRGKNNTVY